MRFEDAKTTLGSLVPPGSNSFATRCTVGSPPAAGPLYVCPKDHSMLSSADGFWLCRECQTRYPINGDGVALLDVLLNPEAAAFDEQHQANQVLSPQEKQGSIQMVASFLGALAPDRPLHKQSLLDLACGHGALTYGLVHGPYATDCDVYAFDHSVASLGVLARSVRNESACNRLYLSTQDVFAPAYPEGFFDFIFGSAVLHHFLDVESVFLSCHRLLKGGGAAIFAEPFAAGYVLITTLMRLAAQLVGVSSESPNTGMYEFITNNIAYRLRHANDRQALSTLTDKHLFTDEWLVKTGSRMGFAVETHLYAPDAFYDAFMHLMLNEYGIHNQPLRNTCLDLYSGVRGYLGPVLSQMFAHYKFIVLRK